MLVEGQGCSSGGRNKSAVGRRRAQCVGYGGGERQMEEQRAVLCHGGRERTAVVRDKSIVK